MTWLFKMLVKMSPEIVDALKVGLKKLCDDLEEKAKKTENKWDDIAVAMLRNTLGVDE